MKRLSVTLLILIAAVLLAGCAATAPAGQPQTAPSAGEPAVALPTATPSTMAAPAAGGAPMVDTTPAGGAAMRVADHAAHHPGMAPAVAVTSTMPMSHTMPAAGMSAADHAAHHPGMAASAAMTHTMGSGMDHEAHMAQMMDGMMQDMAGMMERLAGMHQMMMDDAQTSTGGMGMMDHGAHGSGMDMMMAMTHTMPMSHTMPMMGGMSSDMQHEQHMGSMMQMMGQMMQMMGQMHMMGSQGDMGMMDHGALGSGMDMMMPMTHTMPMSHTMPMMDGMDMDMQHRQHMGGMMQIMGQMMQMMGQMHKMGSQSGMGMMDHAAQGSGMCAMMGGEGCKMMQHGAAMTSTLPITSTNAAGHAAHHPGVAPALPVTPTAAVTTTLPVSAAAVPAAATTTVEANPLAKTEEAGGVSVSIAPLALQNQPAGSLQFDVALRGDTLDPSTDLARLASLRAGGREVRATTWQLSGATEGVRGVLSFPAVDAAGQPIVADSGTLILTVRNLAGVPLRVFAWTLGAD